MLRELIRVLTDRRTVLDEMSREFMTMLKINRDMFTVTTDLLCLGGDKDTVKKQIFPADKKLNKIEQRVRRQVVTHISIAGPENLASVLVFLSVVRDAERMGDNTKNIYDLCDKVPDFAGSQMGRDAVQVRNDIIDKMNDLIDFYPKANNAKKARQYTEEVRKTMKFCDKTIAKLIDDGDKIAGAVAYTLFFRYSKRILAQMSNISTSLFMPVDKLDFFDEVKPKKA